MTSPATSPSSQQVLITGANRGIGLGLVRHYLCEQSRVIAATRAPQQADELSKLREKHGDALRIEQLDVTSDESIKRLAQQLSQSAVTLDLLINNAGICPEEAFGNWTPAGFQSQYNTNVIGPALVAQAVAPLMSPGLKLVNISSGMGSIEQNLNPSGPYDGYSISKAALNMVTRRLAAHLQPKQITVICMDPGWVQTDMGGSGAPTSVDEAVQQITSTIDQLTIDQTGSFLHASGAEVPW